jgi:signal peptidase I
MSQNPSDRDRGSSSSSEPGPSRARRAASEVRATARTVASALLVALVLRAFVVQAYEIPSNSMVPTLEVGDRVFVSKLAYGARLPFSEETLVRWSSPHRGDIVVFSDPAQGIDLIKRVVAVAGDRVEMKNDILYVNGQPVPRTPLGECRYEDKVSDNPLAHPPVEQPAPAGVTAEQWGKYRCLAFREELGGRQYSTVVAPDHPAQYSVQTTVPPGHVFVMGDHRDSSADSRYYGPVPVSRLRGRALAIFWSRGSQMRWDRLGHSVR